MANGQSQELNQVSRTSSSWRRAAPQAGHAGGSSRNALCWPLASQYQTGMRWPHQSWREMFQSRIPVSHCSNSTPRRSGLKRTSPFRYASSAGAASGSIVTNHWSLSRGSTTVSQR